LKAPRPALQPDTWFTVDRDAHAGGYWYVVFNTGRAAYAAARQQGQVLGVRGPGTNTNSCDTPLLAVGNTPYTGRNPPKYLNAEFNWLRVRDHQGQWVEVQHDTEVRVSKAGPVLAQASVGNTQEAEWLTVANAKGRPGAVFLASTPGSGLSVRQAIPRNTPRLADAEWAEFELAPELGAPARVELQMTADARAWFGEKRRFSLVPVP
jgi:hypothetical protein